jgi:hypothetical protein
MTHIGSSGCTLAFFALLTCVALMVVPVSAATKYLGGAPSFSAEVTGINEFAPGEDATISILVKNSGINEVKQLDVGTIEPDDLPNTAKMVTIGLVSDSDAIRIKTDPQMVGDIRGNGNSVIVKFKAKISSNATAGQYQLPLSIRYQYPRVIVQEAADVFEFAYNKAEDTLPITVRIKPQVKIEVLEVAPEQLTAGSQGYLNLKIRNNGPENGEMATVKLIRSGNSPVIPADSTIFIGSFPKGGIIECRYKVSISKDATNQTYPVDVAVSYTNREGTMVTSSTETIGVPIKSKTAFTITSQTSEVPKGGSSTIEVQYRNIGCVTAWNAQARISPHNPITINDNTAYLGDLAPGETAVARYAVEADAAAEPMEYTFDSTIRFRDAQGSSQESDVMPVQIAIIPAASGISAIPGGLPALAGCVIIIISIAVLIYRRMQGNQ